MVSGALDYECNVLLIEWRSLLLGLTGWSGVSIELFKDDYEIVHDATFDTDATEGRNEILFGIIRRRVLSPSQWSGAISVALPRRGRSLSLT